MFLLRVLFLLNFSVLSNYLLIFSFIKPMFPVRLLLLCFMFILYAFYNISPRAKWSCFTQQEVLMGGRMLLIDACLLFMFEIGLYIYCIFYSGWEISVPILIMNGIFAVVLLSVCTWNGIIRILCTSKQLRILMKILLVVCWWVPIVNLVVYWRCCHVVSREHLFAITKNELNESRKENDICKTKYPILLVHGIFWRDWQIFNYWGRIPNELIRNGATVYYGNQQSAAPMETVGEELKNQILDIIQKENCEKVNIIAHSKGGLDARFTISCMGIENHVASLTTVCTPHTGSELVDRALKLVPDSFVQMFAKRYNAIYKKLGDSCPDFYNGVQDLTTARCARFNEVVLDKETVLYQSVTSKMNGIFSAGFPLNVGYAILKPVGENDGFVTVESSKWGKVLGVLETGRRRGISHGDMIDLTRKNIRDFDVCEWYVELVKDLKEKGL